MRPSLDRARWRAAKDVLEPSDEEWEEVEQRARKIRWPNGDVPEDEQL